MTKRPNESQEPQVSAKETKTVFSLNTGEWKEVDIIADQIKRSRQKLNLSQNELHKLTGISREVLRAYESGRNKPGAREIRLLCNALQISPNQLLLGREEFFANESAVDDWINEKMASAAKKLLHLALASILLHDKELEAIFILIKPILAGRHGGEQKLRELFEFVDSHLEDPLLMEALTRVHQQVHQLHSSVQLFNTIKDKKK